jgi:hypothetical protein
MIYRRVDAGLFDSEDTVNYLIEHSGGHLRELLRLLNNAFLAADNDQFDRKSAEKAVQDLANDFRHILDAEDYKLLREVDQSADGQTGNSERVQRLLYNLALLEYNAYWWRSHPVIRTLAEYQAALAG